MKITLRLIISLLGSAILVASVFSYFQYQNEQQQLTAGLVRQASGLASSMETSVTELMESGPHERLTNLLERYTKRVPSTGIAVFDTQGVFVEGKEWIDSSTVIRSRYLPGAGNNHDELSGYETLGGVRRFIFALPLFRDEQFVGTLLLVNDASDTDQRLSDILRTDFLRLLVLALFISVMTVLMIRWSIIGPIAQVANWIQGLRLGKERFPINIPRGDILGPLAKEVTLLARNLTLARASAEAEARLRVESESTWTSERLRETIRQELGAKNLYLISNREPYLHQKKGGETSCIVPAGGLVTALDPVMRSCGGLWIAHGSGDADMETSDQNGKLAVPPDEPSYTLKRVWLSREEEEGYYYGFSNEGIWPLCHITHTRPIFRAEDWKQYQVVNQKFADALLEEIKEEEEPIVLIQDYHFALLPYLIKTQRPDARVALFWHIPWPNPESFGICPWKRELLIGLLSSDLLGFHIQYHCNNFLESVDQFLESKIDWEKFSVERNGQFTFVKPFPISVAYPVAESAGEENIAPPSDLIAKTVQALGKTVPYIGVGVDRIDYTKGIAERYKAIERFFEKYPEFKQKMVFVELGAPSRTHIKRYHDLLAEIEQTANEINWKLQTLRWKPILYFESHHDHARINLLYKAARFCMVTSLHDGMNLVAKEFVASRNDDDGVLILSQFTGAARELQDALIVNPYDIDEMADAIYQAVTMPDADRKERMQRMHAELKEYNIYRWAGSLVSTLCRIRVKKPVQLETA
ncbi:MAG TPA: trehalose-6-phosphate synthase [Bacteroidota bacterium]|nr:trehalose-6-phosphate synthase [Bacteroidota bacterium]